MPQHHFSGQNEGAGVDFVLPSVLWCCAVGGLKDGDARVVVDVGTWCNANAANLCSESIGNVVAVQVHGRQHTVFGGTSDDLLQHGVGNDVLDDDVVAGLGVCQGAPRSTVKQFSSKLFLGQCIAPVAEPTFGELHDVAFVHQRHAGFVRVDGVLNSGANDSGRSFLRNGFDANP